MNKLERVGMYTVEEFHKQWLRGSTCYHQKTSVFHVTGCNRFIIMKHHGHSEYMNRFSGTEYCSTYYMLYDLWEPLPNCFGEPNLGTWVGRWKKVYLYEVKSIILQQ